MGNTAPKIYLAGKISHNDWRHDVVDGYADGIQAFGGWHGSTYGPSLVVDGHPRQWPTLRRAVFDTFDYVGPYFNGEGHGVGHMPLGDIALADGDLDLIRTGATAHGWSGLAVSVCHMDTVTLCLQALQATDIVYAWLDDPTAHGTFAEIGYARALGKTIWLDGPLWNCHPAESELWFVSNLSNGDLQPGVSQGDTPRASLEALAKEFRRYHAPLESEIERMLWKCWMDMGEPYELTPAHPVSVDGANYRLDFAHLPSKLAVELDGYAYHSSKEAFVKDRERQRRLTAAGWTFVRFAGKEITDDASGCAHQLAGVIRSRSNLS